MPRTLWLFLAIMTTALSAAFAQITITANDIPGPGTTMIHHDLEGVTVNNAPSGPNQSWNVPYPVDDYTDSESEQIVAPASTPFAASFPTATHAVTIPGSNSYSFMRVATNGIFLQGNAANVGGQDVVQVFETEGLLAPLPLTYGASWTTVVGFSFDTLGASVTIIDSTIRSIDGWGSITTAYGTWSVLRMSQHNYFVQRIIIPNLPPQITIEEEWSYGYRTQSGFAGVEIYDVVDRNHPNLTDGNVYVSEIGTTSTEPVRGPVADHIALGQNYPNPFNPNTVLPLELDHTANVTLDVYDETGRLVSSQEMLLPAGSHQLPIDGSNWATGTYFARVSAGEQMQTAKMMLLK